MNNDDFLAHYGVKGMKWGVRRSGKKLVKRKRAMDKAERKWRETPKRTGARSRRYVNYRLKKDLYNRQSLRDKSKTVGLSKREQRRYKRLGPSENLYRIQKSVKVGATVALAGGAVTYGAMLSPTGRRTLASGARMAAKYANAAKNFNSGVYINEKGRRQYVSPNFGGTTRLVG